MASQTLRSPEKEQQVLREIRLTGNVKKALSSSRVPRATWYGWLDEDDALRAAHESAKKAGRENRADEVEDALMDRVRKGDTTAIIFAAKTLRREIYGDRSTLEHTGPDGAPLVVTFASRPDGPA